MRCLAVLAISIAALLSSGPRGGEASSRPAEPLCRRAALADAPTQFPSATWSADGAELVIPDVGAGRLVRYDREGKLLGSVTRGGSADLDFPHPTQVHAIPGGFVVRHSANRWVWLNRKFQPLRALAPQGRPKLSMIYEVLRGEEAVGLGAFAKADGSFSFGFLEATLDPPLPGRVFEEIDLESKRGTLYYDLCPVIARLGDKVYALRLGEPSSIVDLSSSGVRLKAFPAGFDVLPSLPRSEGPESVQRRQLVLEKSTIPTGLFGQGRYLYVLTRERASAGKTTWRLHRIDPKKDAVEASLVLPTAAPDLTLSPGPERWALLEKGTMTARNGARPVTSSLWIERSWFEKAGGGAGNALRCP